MSLKTLTIATRKSTLALQQANWVKVEIEKHYPDYSVQFLEIQTEGDKFLDVPLAKFGGKGIFIKALEEALLSGEADLAVHSLKDMPYELPSGLTIAAIPKRADPRDAFISPKYASLKSVPSGARIGTSSLRRQAQVLHLRSDLEVLPLRGNVNTRLRKLEEGEYEGIILAVAGLERLELQGVIREIFEIDAFLPAVGQGALAIECRSDHQTLIDQLQKLHHKSTEKCVLAERSLLAALEAGCHSSVASYAMNTERGIKLHGQVMHPSGKPILKVVHVDRDPLRLGQMVAKSLQQLGANEILKC